MTKRILLLGGTLEARLLAGRLAEREGVAVTLSLAGRTSRPLAQPVPIRSGGFGGESGLADYLIANAVELLIDGTHPYAAQISRNAAGAAHTAHVPIIAMRRPAWEPVDGDRWIEARNPADAVCALGDTPRRIFVTLGRQELAPFAVAPQHAYLVRSVDPVHPPLRVPAATYILARGPFDEAEERALLLQHRIEMIVSKNSGGSASYGKIAAARALGFEIIMLARPELPDVPSATTIEDTMALIDHALAPREARGV